MWFINAPYQGAPVTNFDPTGDLYWKAFPADAMQRCDGKVNLTGLEFIAFDTDFYVSEVLWAYTITEEGGAGDGLGTLDVTFLLGEDTTVRSAADAVLLIDEDGDFRDARRVGGTARFDPHRNTLLFEGVDLSGGRFFALGLFPGN